MNNFDAGCKAYVQGMSVISDIIKANPGTKMLSGKECLKLGILKDDPDAIYLITPEEIPHEKLNMLLTARECRIFGLKKNVDFNKSYWITPNDIANLK